MFSCKTKHVVCALAGVAALSSGLVGAAELGLTPREMSIVPIAAYTATGNEKALRFALESGLKAGLTVNEIRSVLEQMYAYAGFPRSLTGLGVFVELLQARKAAGIYDAQGREPTSLKKGTDLHELGTKTQTELVGNPVVGPIFTFSPNIDRYLKDHLFGAVFANDLLTWREREIATIAALSALPATAQLRSHLKTCLNIGIAPEELRQWANVVRDSVGAEAGKLAAESVDLTLNPQK